MTSIIEEALHNSPQEMHDLLLFIGKIYQGGNVRIWDVLAVIAGYSRGNGNSWYFTALELQKQINEDSSEGGEK